MNDRMALVRIFLAAAEAPSFREAAVGLAVSPQVVSRAVRDLEEALGDVLFHRSTRRIQLTDFGRAFSQEARQAAAVVDGLFARQKGPAEEAIQGMVRVTAPTAVGQRVVWPVLRRLMLAHPGLRFDLRLSDAMVDSVDQRIDLGVRIGTLRDSRFVARAVASVPLLICAAPSLLARTGPLKAITELPRMPVTALVDHNTGRPWPWVFNRDRQFVPEHPVFTTDDQVAECEAVLAGAGMGQLPWHLVSEHVRSGALVLVLPETAPKPWPLSVYRARRDPVPARLRLAFNALIDAFKDDERFRAP